MARRAQSARSGLLKGSLYGSLFADSEAALDPKFKPRYMWLITEKHRFAVFNVAGYTSSKEYYIIDCKSRSKLGISVYHATWPNDTTSGLTGWTSNGVINKWMRDQIIEIWRETL